MPKPVNLSAFVCVTVCVCDCVCSPILDGFVFGFCGTLLYVIAAWGFDFCSLFSRIKQCPFPLIFFSLNIF